MHFICKISLAVPIQLQMLGDCSIRVFTDCSIRVSRTHTQYNYRATRSKATVEREAKSAQWGTLCLAPPLLKDL